MRVLVTGGAGFIGSNLVRQLHADGVSDVVVIDDLSSGYDRNLAGLDVELHPGSILDQALLSRACHGVDAIVHLAALPSVPRSVKDPVATHQANATGTLYVLEAARQVDAHVVVASSSSVYGANPVLPKHEDLRPVPMSPYAVSKLATETYALAYQHVYGLPVLAFRFFNVYGPRQAADHAYAAVVPTFLDRALRGEPLLVHGDGRQTRDFTFVETVTHVLSRSVRERVTSDGPVNLAFGTRQTLLELITLLEAALGTSVHVVHTEPRAGDVRDSQADRTRLTALFPGVVPVSLAAGVAATAEWMRHELAVRR
jgi:UDP-glucose 4-epimerase